MPYMYILECADGSYYTGSAWNIERRLWQHQKGEGANHTRKRLPVKLVYCEPYDRVEDAFRREKQIQGWSRRKKQALIERNPKKLIEYSRNYTQYGKGASASTGSASVSLATTVRPDGPKPESPPTQPELVEGGRGTTAHDPPYSLSLSKGTGWLRQAQATLTITQMCPVSARPRRWHECRNLTMC